MATLQTVQSLVVAGIQPTYINADETDGHKFNIVSGRVAAHVVNGDSSPTTVTIKGGQGRGGRYYADRTVAVPAGEQRWIRFQETDDRGGDDKGRAEIAFSNETSVTFALLDLT